MLLWLQRFSRHDWNCNQPCKLRCGSQHHHMSYPLDLHLVMGLRACRFSSLANPLEGQWQFTWPLRDRSASRASSLKTHSHPSKSWLQRCDQKEGMERERGGVGHTWRDRVTHCHKQVLYLYLGYATVNTYHAVMSFGRMLWEN
jgi:hypothetical protein